MSLATFTLVDAETLDAVIGLLEAQLPEHEITTSRNDLRAVAQTVIADRRHGFMLVARAHDRSFYVLPQWRGRGIGSRLIAEVVARAKESGWRALDLEVEASHQRAISPYARHQFQPHSGSDFTGFSEMRLRTSHCRSIEESADWLAISQRCIPKSDRSHSSPWSSTVTRAPLRLSR